MFAHADLRQSMGGKSFAWLIKLLSTDPLLRVMETKMSQSSSDAPGWQLDGNAPLAYDTHIVDASSYRTTRADLWKSPRLNRAIACWTSHAALAL